MNRKFGISVAGAMGLVGCSDPAVGDWSLTAIESEVLEEGEGTEVAVSGDLTVDKELAANGSFGITFSITYEGETDEAEDGGTIEGSLTKGEEKKTYTADLDTVLTSLTLNGEDCSGYLEDGENLLPGDWSCKVDKDELRCTVTPGEDDDGYEATFVFTAK